MLFNKGYDGNWRILKTTHVISYEISTHTLHLPYLRTIVIPKYINFIHQKVYTYIRIETRRKRAAKKLGRYGRAFCCKLKLEFLLLLPLIKLFFFSSLKKTSPSFSYYCDNFPLTNSPSAERKREEKLSNFDLLLATWISLRF